IGAAAAGGLVQNIVGSMTESMHGAIPKEAAAEGIAGLGSFAAQLPIPMAAMVTTVTGAISSIITAMNAEANRMRDRASAAFGSVLTGAKSAQQAISGVRLEVLEQGFGQMANDLLRIQQSGARGGIAEVINQFAQVQPNLVGQLLDQQIDTVVQRAERTAELT